MESPTTPQKTQPALTSSFASAPLQSLLTTDLKRLSPEELRDFTNHLRSLRTAQPVLMKKLREEAPEETDEVAKPKKTKKAKTEKALNEGKLLDEYLS